MGVLGYKKVVYRNQYLWRGHAADPQVIALGVPTVVDAATIVQDAVFKDCTMEDQDFLDRKEKITGAMDELYNMYVTGKDVDYEIQQISHIICNAIHLALEL